MALVLVTHSGNPAKTQAGSAFVARNRRALAAVLPQDAPHLRAVYLDTATPERGDYWRVPIDAVYAQGHEIAEFPYAVRDYLGPREARRTVQEIIDRSSRA